MPQYHINSGFDSARDEPLFSYNDITVISGPTSVGKGTITSALKEKHKDSLWFSVSATTRPPRKGEVEGVHYYFLTLQEFDDLIKSNDFLEWAVVHKKNKYGTPKGPVIQATQENKKILLELDLQGVRQVKPKLNAAKYVFIKPPKFDDLLTRIKGRATESDEEIAIRLETAKKELEAEKEFEHVVINDNLEDAIKEVEQIIFEDRKRT